MDPGSRSPRITGIAFSIKLLDLIAQTGTFAYIAHVGSSYVDNPEQPVTMRLTSHTIRGEESCYRERERAVSWCTAAGSGTLLISRTLAN